MRTDSGSDSISSRFATSSRLVPVAQRLQSNLSYRIAEGHAGLANEAPAGSVRFGTAGKQLQHGQLGQKRQEPDDDLY